MMAGMLLGLVDFSTNKGLYSYTTGVYTCSVNLPGGDTQLSYIEDPLTPPISKLLDHCGPEEALDSPFQPPKCRAHRNSHDARVTECRMATVRGTSRAVAFHLLILTSCHHGWSGLGQSVLQLSGHMYVKLALLNACVCVRIWFE